MARPPTALSLRPKRSLGQNFLTDDAIARRIAAAVAPAPEDLVVEIGPGRGALTRHLARSGCMLVLVELDDRMIGRLRAEFGGERIAVLHQDFLTLDLAALAAGRGHAGRLRVAGNIPYNITSPILFHVLEQRRGVADLTMMMQREVARRLAAGPGTKDYGILSVTCQLLADVELLFDVSPNAFVPKPQVVSSVVRLRFLPEPRYPVRDEAMFRAMVRAVFGKRRKTLRNSLSYFREGLEAMLAPAVDLQRRPEQLSVRELVDLSNRIYDQTQHQHAS